MSQQPSGQIIRVSSRNTRARIKADLLGYCSPALVKWEKPNYDIDPITALLRFSPHGANRDTYEHLSFRGFRKLYRGRGRLPEIQRVDLSLSRAQRVLFGNCAKQRSAFAYASYTPRHARPETLTESSARLASRKVKVRYGLRRERAPHRLEELAVDHGSVLYVTMRCALCGSTRRIKITARNQGRETPMCSKCGKQIMFVAKIKRVSNH